MTTPSLGGAPAAPDTSQQRAAAEARWNAESFWHETPIDDAMVELARLRKLTERAGEIIQTRLNMADNSVVSCYICDTQIDTRNGRFAGVIDRLNVDTGLIERAYGCSAGCFQLTQGYFRQYGHNLPDKLKRPDRNTHPIPQPAQPAQAARPEPSEAPDKQAQTVAPVAASTAATSTGPSVPAPGGLKVPGPVAPAAPVSTPPAAPTAIPKPGPSTQPTKPPVNA